ncbi:MAG: DNA polymerase III subunit delta [Myxococcales bacterium]
MKGVETSESGDLRQALAEIAAGRARSVYLLHGDEYLCRTAAQEIALALVPEASRDLNLVVLDSAASPLRVAEELRTVPMFRGTKAVWVQPAEFLAPRKAGRGDPWGKVRELWGAGRRRDAARRLLAMAGRAGFALAELGRRTQEEWDRAGLPLKPGDGEIISGVLELAGAEEMEIPEGDTRALEALLTGGLPPGHHLVAVAEEIDGASALAKLCRARGLEIERSLRAAAGAGKRPEADAGALAREVLASYGKSIPPDAARLLVSRVGSDARALASELEKLASYVGERPSIQAKDVLELVPQTAGEDYFALGNALEARDPRGMLLAIEAEIELGAPPLKILAGLAASLRALLSTRAQLAEQGVQRGMSFQEFERRVLPKLAEADRRAGRKAQHPFRAFKRAEASLRWRRTELARALLLCAEADVALKRSMDGRSWLTRLAVAMGAKA